MGTKLEGVMATMGSESAEVLTLFSDLCSPVCPSGSVGLAVARRA